MNAIYALATVFCAVLAAAVASPANAEPDQAVRSNILQAFGIGDELILLRDTHKLFSLPLSGGKAQLLTANDVRMIASDGMSLWALEFDPGSSAAAGTVRRYSTRESVSLPPLPPTMTEIMGLAVSDRRPIVIATNEIAIWTGEDWKATEIDLDFDYHPSMELSISITFNQTTIYVGENRGEFGCNLFQIDLKTGVSKSVRCSNIAHFLASSLDPDCMIVSNKGAMLPNGSIMKYCSDRVEVAFTSTIKDGFHEGLKEDFFSSLFDPQGNLLSSGHEGIFIIRDGRYRFRKYGKVRIIDDVYLTEVAPGIVAVSPPSYDGTPTLTSPILVKLEGAPNPPALK